MTIIYDDPLISDISLYVKINKIKMEFQPN